MILSRKKTGFLAMIQLLAITGALLESLSDLHAQSVPVISGSPAPVRLQEYEATFQQELRKIHAPLLSGYLLSLQTLARTASPAEQPAVQAEIVRVQKLIASGTALDLAIVAAALKNTGTPVALPADLSGLRDAGAVLELKAEQALEFSPTGVYPETLPLGTASWNVSTLAAGGYEVLVQYACPALPAGQFTLSAAIGPHKTETVLKPARVTKSALDFKILRLGRLQISETLANETLKLTLSPPAADTPFRIQRLILAKKTPTKPAP
jgi:hypothetical protein